MRLTRPVMTRMQLATWLVAAPAICGALGAAAMESRRVMSPASAVERDEDSGSLAEAIRQRNVEDAYAFVRAGHDPNAPIAVQDPQLTGDRRMVVSPLLLAVASNSDGVVMMLMSAGARVDAPANRLAECLARRLGYNAIAEILLRDGGSVGPVTCPALPPAPMPPLPAFVEQVP
jgi:hypothetical protein